MYTTRELLPGWTGRMPWWTCWGSAWRRWATPARSSRLWPPPRPARKYYPRLKCWTFLSMVKENRQSNCSQMPFGFCNCITSFIWIVNASSACTQIFSPLENPELWIQIHGTRIRIQDFKWTRSQNFKWIRIQNFKWIRIRIKSH